MKYFSWKMAACLMAALLICLPVLTGCDDADEPETTVSDITGEPTDGLTEKPTEEVTEDTTEETTYETTEETTYETTEETTDETTEDIESGDPYQLYYYIGVNEWDNYMNLNIDPTYKKPFCLEIPAYDPNGNAIKRIEWVNLERLEAEQVSVRECFGVSELPRMILKEDFERLLARAENYYEGGKDDFNYFKFNAYWILVSMDKCQTEEAKQELLEAWPWAEICDFYVLDTRIEPEQEYRLVQLLHEFAPDYTAYEDELKFSKVAGVSMAEFSQCVERDGWYKGGHYVEEVKIHEGIELIDALAFQWCTGLKSINIPSSVYYIGGAAFQGCYQLESIVLPEGVQYICNDTFDYCSSLSEITIPKTLTHIYCYRESGGFASYSGVEHHIYYGGTVAEWNRIELASMATTADRMEHPFHGWTIHCSDGEFVEESKGITQTDKQVFVSNGDGTCRVYWRGVCTDEEAVLPTVSPAGDRVTGIGYSAIGGTMKRVVIPDSITSIDQNAFYSCWNFTDVDYSGTKAQWKLINIHEDNVYLLDATIHCTDGDIIPE